MSESLKTVLRDLKNVYDAYLQKYQPTSEYEEACIKITHRAYRLASAIALLKEHNFPTEAAILHRTQLNLHLIFKYIIRAQFVENKWKFEDDPSDEQIALCKKYLNWHWIELARRNPNIEKVVTYANSLAPMYGYSDLKHIPRRFQWYFEGKVKSIWDLAKKSKGVKDYETYSFLSGLEHSDTSSIYFEELSDANMESSLLADAVFVFGYGVDVTLKVCKQKSDQTFKQLIARMDEAIAVAHKPLRDALLTPKAP